jgi:L-ascorbate metabolism protein UlaG (beta-lactamase superfamily)
MMSHPVKIIQTSSSPAHKEYIKRKSRNSINTNGSPRRILFTQFLYWNFLRIFANIYPYMVINYFGNGCFRLQSGDTSVLVNPDNNRLKADVTLKTLAAAGAEVVAEPSEEVVISFAGEYEEKEIEILGFPITEESTDKFLKTAYAVLWEGMKFVFLGHLSKPVDATLMEEFSEPDILFLPVGGGHFLEPEVAAKIAKQLEARIVIPSFYKDPGEFLKAFGKKGEEMDKFVFKQKDIATDSGRVVILKAS